MGKAQRDKFRILVADDSDMNREFLQDMLEENYEVVLTASGSEVLALLEKEGAESFDLLLLDIFMPDVDGFQVLEQMQKKGWNDDLPVVIISSATSTNVINRAFELGARDFVNRPFNVHVIKQRVANTILLTKKEQNLSNVLLEQLKEKENDDKLMMNLLSQVVSYRNGDTNPQLSNMSAITSLLLQKLAEKAPQYGLSEEQMDLIAKASSLHDIGKMAIDDAILNKPGRLTSEEFEIIKTHTREGAELLNRLEARNMPLVQEAVEISLWHHERYDGSGYPDQLVGDAIPIAAQVVSLADVYDALTSDRAYKPAYPHAVAMTMILNGECGTFNPILLDCLKELDTDLADLLKPGQQKTDGKKAALKINMLTDRWNDYQSRRETFDQARIDFLQNHTRHLFVSVQNKKVSLNQAAADYFKCGPEISLDEVELVPPLYSLRAQERISQSVELKIRGVGGRMYLRAERVMSGGEKPVLLGWQAMLSPEHTVDFDMRVPEGMSLTAEQAESMIRMLSTFFDKVRLVDPTQSMQLQVCDGKLKKDGSCFDIWKKNSRCAHCISAACVRTGQKMAKFELMDGEVYFVIANPVEVDGKMCCLEMMDHLPDNALLMGMPDEDVHDSLAAYQKRLYQDALTVTENRRFYEEKLKNKANIQAVAMIDVNKFKEINDKFGHQAGDLALQRVAWTIKDAIRKTDYVVRYGGDEFVVVFPEIPPQIFKRKLEEIAKAVSLLQFKEYPDMTTEVSVGGIYGPGQPDQLLHIADDLMYKAKKAEPHLRVLAPQGDEPWIFGNTGKR